MEAIKSHPIIVYKLPKVKRKTPLPTIPEESVTTAPERQNKIILTKSTIRPLLEKRKCKNDISHEKEDVVI
jgi:hypothetical protein